MFNHHSYISSYTVVLSSPKTNRSEKNGKTAYSGVHVRHSRLENMTTSAFSGDEAMGEGQPDSTLVATAWASRCWTDVHDTDERRRRARTVSRLIVQGWPTEHCILLENVSFGSCARPVPHLSRRCCALASEVARSLSTPVISV